MSNWKAILGGGTVCVEVFIECHCCNARLSLSAEDMTDEFAIKLAHDQGWTVMQTEGQTLCPKCQKLSDEDAFAVYAERLKGKCPHHQICLSWAKARARYYE